MLYFTEKPNSYFLFFGYPEICSFLTVVKYSFISPGKSLKSCACSHVNTKISQFAHSRLL